MYLNLVAFSCSLAQAIIVFIAGEHDDAISRVHDLAGVVQSDPICHVVQACA